MGRSLPREGPNASRGPSGGSLHRLFDGGCWVMDCIRCGARGPVRGRGIGQIICPSCRAVEGTHRDCAQCGGLKDRQNPRAGDATIFCSDCVRLRSLEVRRRDATAKRRRLGNELTERNYQTAPQEVAEDPRGVFRFGQRILAAREASE